MEGSHEFILTDSCRISNSGSVCKKTREIVFELPKRIAV
jgi:hypothetical protein